MKIHLLKHQNEFLQHKAKFAALVGGIGSGKSRAGSYYSINKMLSNPESLHFIGANTHKQLRDSTLAAMFKTLNEMQLSFSYNQNKALLTVEDGQALCGSLENYDVHRGIEIGSFWLDESRDTPKEAFEMMIGRLRDNKCKKLEGRLTTSPNGFDWIYDYFHKDGEHYTEEYAFIQANSYQNKYLPDGYIESLKGKYSEKLFKQEVMGEFIDISSGKAYYAFSDENIRDTSPFARTHSTIINRRIPIVLGCDFNITPMSWNLGQNLGRQWYWFDEIHIEDSNTPEAARELAQRLLELKKKGLLLGAPNVIICGDASGNNGSTKTLAGETDYSIIKQALRDAGISFDERMPEKNPAVKDRINSVNNLLRSINGDMNMFVHPDCRWLIRDLRRVSWKEGTSDLDKSDASLTHHSDAIGYPVHHLTPVEDPGTEVGTLRVIY